MHAKELRDPNAGLVIALGRSHRKRVRTAVRICVCRLVEITQCIEDQLWLLRCCSGVEVVQTRVVQEKGKIRPQPHGTCTVDFSYLPSIRWQRGPTRIVSPSSRT